MEDIKRAELEMLIAFDKFSKEQGLKYSLTGGSLIGAIRHKGFIPWDDDVDVMMTRPEYDKLLALAKRGCSCASFVFTGYEVDGFPVPFVKMIDPCIRVEDCATRKAIKLNLWLDIFPVDAIPSDDLRARLAYCEAALMRSIIKVGNYRFIGAGKGRVNRLLKMIAKPFVHIFGLDHKAEKRITAIARSFGSFESAEYVGGFVWGYGMRERVPRSVFEGSAFVEFEGHVFSSIAGWNEWLTSIYGDFMALPPEEARVLRHDLKAWYTEPLK